MLFNKIDALLRLKNTTITNFAKSYNISQSNLSQKRKKNSYYLKEAVLLAEYTNTRLAFIDDNDQPIITFDRSDLNDD